MTLLTINQQKLNSINNRITNIIIQNVDEETGEISERIMDDLEQLELSKDEITKVSGIAYHQYKSLSEQVTAEKKRLNDLEKSYKKSMESFKNMMDKILGGDSFECESFKCSYNKSHAIDLEDGYTEDDIPNEWLRIKKELDKKGLKEMYKTTGALPEGIINKENNNLVIK